MMAAPALPNLQVKHSHHNSSSLFLLAGNGAAPYLEHCRELDQGGGNHSRLAIALLIHLFDHPNLELGHGVMRQLLNLFQQTQLSRHSLSYFARNNRK